jgi:hypothetical protein
MVTDQEIEGLSDLDNRILNDMQASLRKPATELTQNVASRKSFLSVSHDCCSEARTKGAVPLLPSVV